MEISLKQRLIGASVLIALAVIFVPMFLDGSGQERRTTNESIVVPEPEFKFEEQLPRLDKVGSEPLATFPPQTNGVATPKATMSSEESLSTPSPAASPQKPPAKSQPIVKPSVVPEVQAPLVTKPNSKSKPTTQAKPTSSGWVVQVGSFRHKKNALDLRNKLRRAGYAAFEDAGGNTKKPIYRVKVGPESRRDRAITLRARLLSQQKLKGIVIQHP